MFIQNFSSFRPDFLPKKFSGQRGLSRSRRLSFVIFLGAFLWCAGFFLAPALTGSAPEAAGGLYALYGQICHQMGDRSLHIEGHPVAVCARCLSVYCGFLIGAAIILLVPARMNSPRDIRLLAVAALLPMLVDVASGIAGLSSPSMLSRFLTGGWFGFLSAFFLVPVAIGAMRELLSPKPCPVADAL